LNPDRAANEPEETASCGTMPPIIERRAIAKIRESPRGMLPNHFTMGEFLKPRPMLNMRAAKRDRAMALTGSRGSTKPRPDVANSIKKPATSADAVNKTDSLNSQGV